MTKKKQIFTNFQSFYSKRWLMLEISIIAQKNTHFLYFNLILKQTKTKAPASRYEHSFERRLSSCKGSLYYSIYVIFIQDKALENDFGEVEMNVVENKEENRNLKDSEEDSQEQKVKNLFA